MHLVPAHAAPAMVAPSTPTAATSRLRTSPRRPLRRRRAWLRTSLTSSRSSPSSCTSGGRSLRPAPSWLNRLAGRSTAQSGLRVSGHPACTTTAPIEPRQLRARKISPSRLDLGGAPWRIASLTAPRLSSSLRASGRFDGRLHGGRPSLRFGSLALAPSPLSGSTLRGHHLRPGPL